jgi:hypothetical protein
LPEDEESLSRCFCCFASVVDLLPYVSHFHPHPYSLFPELASHPPTTPPPEGGRGSSPGLRDSLVRSRHDRHKVLLGTAVCLGIFLAARPRYGEPSGSTFNTVLGILAYEMVVDILGAEEGRSISWSRAGLDCSEAEGVYLSNGGQMKMPASDLANVELGVCEAEVQPYCRPLLTM